MRRMRHNTIFFLSGTGAILLSGLLILRAQDAKPAPILEGPAADVAEHPECSFFVNREKFSQAALAINPQTRYRRSTVTAEVVGRLNRAPAGSRLKSFQNPD